MNPSQPNHTKTSQSTQTSNPTPLPTIITVKTSMVKKINKNKILVKNQLRRKMHH